MVLDSARVRVVCAPSKSVSRSGARGQHTHRSGRESQSTLPWTSTRRGLRASSLALPIPWSCGAWLRRDAMRVSSRGKRERERARTSRSGGRRFALDHLGDLLGHGLALDDGGRDDAVRSLEGRLDRLLGLCRDGRSGGRGRRGRVTRRSCERARRGRRELAQPGRVKGGSGMHRRRSEPLARQEQASAGRDALSKGRRTHSAAARGGAWRGARGGSAGPERVVRPMLVGASGGRESERRRRGPRARDNRSFHDAHEPRSDGQAVKTNRDKLCHTRSSTHSCARETNQPPRSSARDASLVKG